MADEKWISGLRPHMPTSEAARLTLSRRLEAVQDRLPGAVFQSEEDTEHVHQLRVSSRRASAALRIFADLLPAPLHQKTKKSLRSLRRAAGEARDWDVMLESMRSRLTGSRVPERRGLDFLLGFAQGHRVLAQQHLGEAYASKAEKFKQNIRDIENALDASRPGPSLTTLAGPMLTTLLQELETAAKSDLQHYEALHKVRILGKQLRYAMEIFECCFAPDFRDKHYPSVVEMQDILGLANDSYSACQRLFALRARLLRTAPKQWSLYRVGIERLIQFHERRLPLQRKKFERWWKAWLKSGGESGLMFSIRAR